MTHQASKHSGQSGAEPDLAARYTIPELADRMRVSRSFVYERVAVGAWPAHRAGYRLFFTDGDVAEIDELTRQPRREQPLPATRPRRRRKRPATPKETH